MKHDGIGKPILHTKAYRKVWSSAQVLKRPLRYGRDDSWNTQNDRRRLRNNGFYLLFPCFIHLTPVYDHL